MIFFYKNLINPSTSIYVQVKRSIPKLQVYRNHSCCRNFEFRTSISTSVLLGFCLHTLEKSNLWFNIWCILRFAKNCNRENKDTTFDHKIAKFDTRENFRLYGSPYSIDDFCHTCIKTTFDTSHHKYRVICYYYLGQSFRLLHRIWTS